MVPLAPFRTAGYRGRDVARAPKGSGPTPVGLADWPWEPPDGVIAIAEEAGSYPAVAGSPRSAVTLHFSFLLDRLALRRMAFSTVQDARAERRAVRGALVAFAYSQRVARLLGRKVHTVPIGYALPDEVLVPNESPVAAMMADWSWPPNRQALSFLLEVWPEVVAAVPQRAPRSGRAGARP